MDMDMEEDMDMEDDLDASMEAEMRGRAGPP